MKTIYTHFTGTQHLNENKECQDIIKVYETDDLNITVLCDGAGSKKFGTKSATLVAKTTIEYFKNGLNNFNASEFIEHINNTLEENELNEKNAGTTHIFLDSDKSKYIIGHLGDGVVLENDGNGFKAVSLPENGHLANITYFLPSEEATEHFRYKTGKLNNKSSFILSSDGAASFLYDSSTLLGYNACNLLEEWAKTLEKSECEKRILTSIETELTKFSSDDMSIAISIYK